MTLAVAAWAEGVSSGERTVYRWVLQQTSPQVVTALGWINYAGDVRFLIPQRCRSRWPYCDRDDSAALWKRRIHDSIARRQA